MATPSNDAILNQLLAFMKKNDKVTKLRIEGHTDSVGSKSRNQKLSDARAASVAAWLVKHGVDASRFHALGFGLDKPIADNTTAEGRAKNRRTEFHLEEIEGKPAEQVLALAPSPPPPAAAPARAPAPASAPAPAPTAAAAPTAAPPVAPTATVPSGPATALQWNESAFGGNGGTTQTLLGVASTWSCPPAPPKLKADILSGKAGVTGGGNGVYINTNWMCIAAVHAGKITLDQGGTFSVANVGYVNDKFVGSVAHGVTGKDYTPTQPWSAIGFTFQVPPPAPFAIKWDVELSYGFAYKPWAGEQTVTYTCPPANTGAKPSTIHGTDDYSGSSSVCWAAVHAGKIIPSAGGTVTAVVHSNGTTAPFPQKQFKGSTRNGVTTTDSKDNPFASFGFK